MNKPKNRDKDIVVQEFANEILIYDLKTNKAYCLNETSAMIWQMCDGGKTVAEISQSLTKKLKQPITEDVIWLALDGFKKDNLLEQNEQFAINFNGLNRRQVIKKIGFASMIALPLINSVIAPSAVNAASGGNIALLDACATTSECQSGLICTTCQQGSCNNQQVCCTGLGGVLGPNAQSVFMIDIGGIGGGTSLASCNNNSQCEACFTPGYLNTGCCSGQVKNLASNCVCA